MPDDVNAAPVDDMRADLSAAFDKVTAEPSPEPTAVASESPSVPVESEGIAPQPQIDGRVRDEQGRFVKQDTKPATPEKAPSSSKALSPDVAGQGAAAAKPPPAPAPVTPDLKPPQSWKPAAREKWASLPSEVKEEAIRRERETQSALQESSQARDAWQKVQATVRPFEAMIRAEGAEPLRAIGSLLQTAAAFRTAPADTVATQMAAMVQRYGVGRFGPQFIDALASALNGQPAPQGQGQIDPQQMAYRIKQELMGDLARQRDMEFSRKAQEEAHTFSSGKEFFDDVREDMADLMEVAAKRNVAMTFEQAYTKAVAMHPEISEVLKQREAAKAAANAQASTQKAKAASSSVQSRPAGGVGAPAGNGSIRDDLEAAYRASQNR